jgi:chromate transport protein ChrA
MLRKFGFVIGLLSAIIISFLLGFFDEDQPFQIIGTVLTNLIVFIIVTSIYCLFKSFKEFDYKFGIVSLIFLALIVLEMLINKLMLIFNLSF